MTRGFARTLARAGFLALVPDVPGFRALELRGADARGLADDLAFLRSDARLRAGARVGYAAFSFATGPTLIAAMQPDVRDEVDFVVCVGGHFDATRRDSSPT